MIYICNGLLSFYLNKGEDVNLFVGSNTIINEMYYFIQPTNSSCHICITDTEYVEFDINCLNSEAIKANNDIFYKIVQGICIKYIAMENVVRILNIGNFSKRFGRFLLHLYNYYKKDTFQYPLNQNNIAKLLRISKPSMIRIIHEFKQYGMLRDCSYGKIQLGDIEQLCHYVSC